jgi:hypothetical protein
MPAGLLFAVIVSQQVSLYRLLGHPDRVPGRRRSTMQTPSVIRDGEPTASQKPPLHSECADALACGYRWSALAWIVLQPRPMRHGVEEAAPRLRSVGSLGLEHHAASIDCPRSTSLPNQATGKPSMHNSPADALDAASQRLQLRPVLYVQQLSLEPLGVSCNAMDGVAVVGCELSLQQRRDAKPALLTYMAGIISPGADVILLRFHVEILPTRQIVRRRCAGTGVREMRSSKGHTLQLIAPARFRLTRAADNIRCRLIIDVTKQLAKTNDYALGANKHFPG